MGKKNNAGAIASNAGDDFHLIWACKKMLTIVFKDDDYHFHGTPRKPAKSRKMLALIANAKNEWHWEEYCLPI